MAKRGRTSNRQIISNGGGMLGSGVFGSFGTTIRCDASDNSIFCNIMKIFQLLIVLFVVCFFIYLAYSLFNPNMKKSKFFYF